MITVLLAASTSRVRATLAALLDGRKAHHTLVASPELALIDQIEAVRPDVLVLETGGAPPAATLGAVALAASPPAVVLVTDRPGDALEGGRPRAGLAGVLPPHATADELGAAIEAAAAGLLALHPDSARGMTLSRGDGAATRVGAAAAAAGDRALTPREVEVLGMLAEGLGNKAIAARLGITDHTVKFHVAEILDKLDAETRTEAVTIGIRRGLILV